MPLGLKKKNLTHNKHLYFCIWDTRFKNCIFFLILEHSIVLKIWLLSLLELWSHLPLVYYLDLIRTTRLESQILMPKFASAKLNSIYPSVTKQREARIQSFAKLMVDNFYHVQVTFWQWTIFHAFLLLRIEVKVSIKNREFTKFSIKVAWSLQFLGYLRTLILFQKATSKIEVFLSLPCWLSQFSWDSQQGRARKLQFWS